MIKNIEVFYLFFKKQKLKTKKFLEIEMFK